MEPTEAIKTIEIAIAEVEWNYPMDYTVAFEAAVDTILGAKHLYIIGIRSCAPLASFLAFYCNLMFENVHLLTTNSSSELFEQMLRINEEDAIIGISFPRYSMRKSVMWNQRLL